MPRNCPTRIIIICDPAYDVLHIQNAVHKSPLLMQIERISVPSDIHDLSIDNADVVFLDICALRQHNIDPSDLSDTLYSHIPVILLGHEHDGRLALAGIQAGAQDWLLHDQLLECEITPVVENAQRSFQQQRSLIINHARYQSVVEDQSELIYRCTPEHRITFVNQAYSKQLGIPASTLEGTCLSNHSELRQFDAYQRNVSKLSPEFSTAHHEECIQIDGDSYWRHWTDKASFDSNGAMLEIQSMGTDITARRCAEQEAIDAHKRFQSLYDNAPVMMQELDARGRILSVNQCWLEIMEQREKHVIGYHGFRFLDKCSHNTVRKAMEELRRYGRVRNIQCRYNRAIRSPIDIVASATSKLWDENRNIRILIVSTELESLDPLSRRRPATQDGYNQQLTLR